MKSPARVRRLLTPVFLLTLALWSCGGSDPDGGSITLAHTHDASGETCFICDATKRDAGRLWCREHDRYEDRCWICHPDLEDQDRLYCEEHGVYEDECTLCHPELEEGDDESAANSSRPAPEVALVCNEHRVPELECGICQPQRAAELGPGEELKVRFESRASASKAGIRTVAARAIEASASIRVVCQVSYDENSLARITPLASGIVRAVPVDVGADVSPGEVLVEIHSAEVAEAKAAFVSSVVDFDLKDVACRRERRLAEKKISSEMELQAAEAACRTAEFALSSTRQRLLNFGFTEDEVETIREKQDTSAALVVRAPYAGTLVQREAVVGEAVVPGDTLFTLANLDQMWLTLSIPADRTALVRAGMRVEATFDGRPPVESAGELTWLSTMIDERSRMLEARAVVDNETRELRAGMFGEARILLAPAEAAVAIPRDALQLYEDQSFVFVKVEDDLYSLRRIAVLDRPAGDFLAVIDGLQPDELVVSEGAFTVMSEFLKSRLGAGCVDD